MWVALRWLPRPQWSPRPCCDRGHLHRLPLRRVFDDHGRPRDPEGLYPSALSDLCIIASQAFCFASVRLPHINPLRPKIPFGKFDHFAFCGNRTQRRSARTQQS